MGELLNELMYPSTVEGVTELLQQVRDIETCVALNNNLIKYFVNNSEAQQILRNDNEILLSIKKENIEALRHCPPELIHQAKGVK